MILIVNYYLDSNSLRQIELNECLSRNINNDLIKTIIVFHEENVKIPFKKKILSKICTDKPTFKELFDEGNKYQGLKIIANSDIYFNETLELANEIEERQVYALCRWDESYSGLVFYSKLESQDVWIWRSKINVDCDFGLGLPGCDNALLYNIERKGHEVLSPSKQIQAIHLHHTQVRNYEILKNVNKMKLNKPKKYLTKFI